jgi:cardiolipin synthase
VLVVSRDMVIIAGAVTYQFFIEPIQGDATLISKLNTAAQFIFVISTLTAAALQWPTPEVVMFLGAAVVFTSITSGLNYVVSWSKRAWRKIHVAQ